MFQVIKIFQTRGMSKNFLTPSKKHTVYNHYSELEKDGNPRNKVPKVGFESEEVYEEIIN